MNVPPYNCVDFAGTYCPCLRNTFYLEYGTHTCFPVFLLKAHQNLWQIPTEDSLLGRDPHGFSPFILKRNKCAGLQSGRDQPAQRCPPRISIGRQSLITPPVDMLVYTVNISSLRLKSSKLWS
jgi:hypothetical protein